MHANDIHLVYDKHHVVSTCPNPHPYMDIVINNVCNMK